MLTHILSERRIKIQHSTMEMLLVIATNDHCWDQEEREELLKRALEIYMSKSRKGNPTARKNLPAKLPNLTLTVRVTMIGIAMTVMNLKVTVTNIKKWILTVYLDMIYLVVRNYVVFVFLINTV